MQNQQEVAKGKSQQLQPKKVTSPTTSWTETESCETSLNTEAISKPYSAAKIKVKELVKLSEELEKSCGTSLNTEAISKPYSAAKIKVKELVKRCGTSLNTEATSKPYSAAKIKVKELVKRCETSQNTEAISKPYSAAKIKVKEFVKLSEELEKSANSPRATHDFRSDTDLRSGFSPKNMEIFQKPMCLVYTEKNTVFKIEKKTAEQIAKIDWPVVVVAVVGVLRTGKSFLVNCLAELGPTKGFELGHTTDSVTKGIWVFCKVHPKKKNTVLLLLDTEGLGDVKKDDVNHGYKLFTLATLLCNCLVFNMKGVFDQDTVSKLTDFGLKMPVKNDLQLTEDEYLKQSLEENDSKDAKFNNTRLCMSEYFHELRCITFPHPSPDVLQKLQEQQFYQLDEAFKKSISRFLSLIHSCEPKSVLARKQLNGKVFISLAESYVTAIHEDVLCVDDALTGFAKCENAFVVKEALAMFKAEMESVELPVPSHHLQTRHSETQQKALSSLREKVFCDEDSQCELQAKLEMDKVWHALKEENSKCIREKCETTLDQAIRICMKGKLDKRSYEAKGGYKTFKHDLEETVEIVRSAKGLHDFEGNEISSTLFEFMQSMKQEEAKIIETDDALTKQQKEDERNNNKKRMKEKMEERDKEMKAALEKEVTERETLEKKLTEQRFQHLEMKNQRLQELLTQKLKIDELIIELEALKKSAEEKKEKWIFGRIWDAIRNR